MQTRRAILQIGIAGTLCAPAALSAETPSVDKPVDPASLADRQRTPQNLYHTPRGAYAALQENADILFVDVRDPIEISFVGHPQGLDKIIPLGLMTHEINPDTNQYRMVNNPDLIAGFDALRHQHGVSRAHPIFVTCRSGGRSAVAARMLHTAGYSNVWNLIEGFEGDKDTKGVRALNGWRNAGLPWGYQLAPGVAWAG